MRGNLRGLSVGNWIFWQLIICGVLQENYSVHFVMCKFYVRQWEISAAFPLFTYSEVDLHLESQLLSLHATAARK